MSNWYAASSFEVEAERRREALAHSAGRPHRYTPDSDGVVQETSWSHASRPRRLSAISAIAMAMLSRLI